MPIHVTSETGSLKKVLLHRPGLELEHLTPTSLEQLLFDDIPYLAAAQREHDAFAQALTDNGVEVVYLEKLMAETISNRPELRKAFIGEFISLGGPLAESCHDPLFRYLSNIQDDLELIEKTMAGVLMSELSLKGKSPLTDLVRREGRFALEPIPNLYFTRDPFASIGTGVSLNKMYSETRRRETIYARYILGYHPDFAGQVPLYYTPDMPFCIEGGDVLNLSESVLAVGLSQRTSPEAVELLSANMFSDPLCRIRTVLALDIPDIRAFMHLDTVLTQVDTGKFVMHPGIQETLRIYEITPGNGPKAIRARELTQPLEDIFREKLELDSVSLIRCGGKDPIASEREQWNDASNTLCISPGVVAAYDRNGITNNILRDNGITVLEMPSSELSRGRGGPRCMSMPLWRD